MEVCFHRSVGWWVGETIVTKHRRSRDVPQAFLSARKLLLSARKLLLRGVGRVVPGRGAETGCEGVCLLISGFNIRGVFES
jgi:hypothetical protein